MTDYKEPESLRLQMTWVLILSFIVLGVLHATAFYFYLYWTLWWFDIVMHLLGGFSAALFGLGIVFFFKLGKDGRQLVHVLFVAVLFSLLAGVLWELYEFYTGLTFVHSGYISDTMSDIITGMAGGMVAALYTLRKLH